MIYCWLNESFRQSAKQSLENIFQCLKIFHQGAKNGGGTGGEMNPNGGGSRTQMMAGGTTGLGAGTNTRHHGRGDNNNTLSPNQYLQLGHQFETTTIVQGLADEVTAIGPGTMEIDIQMDSPKDVLGK